MSDDPLVSLPIRRLTDPALAGDRGDHTAELHHGMGHDPDHPHGRETLDRRGRRLQRLKSSRLIGKPLGRAAIRR